MVCAFLLMKGWKKQGPIKADKPQDRKEKLKRIYDQEAGKIRKRLSIAKAEIERLKEKIGVISKNNAKPFLWHVWLAGRVFANLIEMLERDPENERPRYKDPGKRARDDSRMFEKRGAGFGESCGKREELGIRTRPGGRK